MMDQLFIVCEGSSALSEFRRSLLAKEIDALDVRAQYMHYVSLEKPDGHDREILKQLLSYGDSLDNLPSLEDHLLRYESLWKGYCSSYTAFAIYFSKNVL